MTLCSAQKVEKQVLMHLWTRAAFNGRDVGSNPSASLSFSLLARRSSPLFGPEGPALRIDADKSIKLVRVMT